MLKLIAFVSAPALITIASPALSAGGNVQPFAETIAHDDLDLTTENGVALLDQRAATIIRRQCANGGRDGASIRLERACRVSAAKAAKEQVRLAVNSAQAAKVRLASGKSVAPDA